MTVTFLLLLASRRLPQPRVSADSYRDFRIARGGSSFTPMAGTSSKHFHREKGFCTFRDRSSSRIFQVRTQPHIHCESHVLTVLQLKSCNLYISVNGHCPRTKDRRRSTFVSPVPRLLDTIG